MTSHIAQLSKMCHPDLRPYIDELNACLREKRMPHSLEQIATDRYRPSNQKQEAYDRYNQTETSLSAQSLSISLWEQKVLNGAVAHQVAPTTILTSLPISSEENKITTSSAIPIVLSTKKRKIISVPLMLPDLLRKDQHIPCHMGK